MATLEWACQTLDKQSTEFYLVHVIPSGIPELVTETYQVKDALTMLDQAKERIKQCGGNIVKAEYLEGDPVEGICQYANDENVDQVLMGSHGRTGLMKMLLGSVSSGVLEHCDRQVFIFKNLAKQQAGIS